MKLTTFLVLICALLNPAAADAGNAKVADIGKAVAIALPIVAGGISIFKSDWDGLADNILVTGATGATTFGLNHLIKERRPDGSDDHSFPSDQAGIAFAPAFFLWHRYGWEYGVPAIAAASFVGFARVDARKHHWYDVMTSAAIGFTYDQIVTRRYHDPGLYTQAYASSEGAFVSLDYQF